MRPTCARRGEARQLQVLLGGSAAMLLLLAVSSYQSYQSAGGGSSGGSGSSAGGSGGGAAGAHGSRRELEAVVSNVTEVKCSGDFGKLAAWELHGGLALHLIATLYVFLGIAIVARKCKTK